MNHLATTLAEARAALDSGAVTSTQLLQQCLGRMTREEPGVRAMVTETRGLAQEQAAKADARLSAGERTPLLGIPVALKDLIDVAGVPTTAGSRVLSDNVPSTSATAWARLEQAGAVLVGKANTHEFAYGGATEPTRNPVDRSRIVGGSSGGPAAALAAGYCLGALGSDTAGSIRIPANLCGVAGLKPTRGLVPAGGVVPLAPSLDVVGPMARSVADLDPLLRVLADVGVAAGSPTIPRSVGVLTNAGPMDASVAEALSSAVQACRHLEAEVVDCRLAGFEEAVADNFTILGHEAHRVHARWADRTDLYSSYVRERLAAAAQVTSGQCERAWRSAHALEREVDRLLGEVDMILMPGVPMPASTAYHTQVQVAGDVEDRDTALCRNTAFANLTGHPVLGMPAGLDQGLPVGIQLVGRHGADFELVAAGARLEAALPVGLPARLADLTD